jgi:hypothetical protein
MHDILELRHHLDAGFVIVALDIFGIGRIDHEQGRRRHARMKASHFRAGQIAAGRIVRVGQEDDAGARADRTQHFVDIDLEILLRHDNGHRAVGER